MGPKRFVLSVDDETEFRGSQQVSTPQDGEDGNSV
jgi:hypothetical protein